MNRFCALLTIAVIAAVLPNRASALQPIQYVCANLFSAASEEIPQGSLHHGHTDLIKDFRRSMADMNLPPSTDSALAREQGMRLAFLAKKTAGSSPMTFYRLLYVVLNSQQGHYSKEFYIAFLSEMFKASHLLEPVASDPSKAYRFFQQLLGSGLQPILELEKRIVQDGTFQPVYYYSKQPWISPEHVRFESSLRGHWKAKLSEPIESDAAAQEEGRALSYKIRKQADGDVQIYARLYYIALTQLHVTRADAFYRGLLDAHFARTFFELDEPAQDRLKQALKQAEKLALQNDPANVLSIVPQRPSETPIAVVAKPAASKVIPAVPPKPAAPVEAKKTTLLIQTPNHGPKIQEGGAPAIHAFIGFLNKKEVESDLVQAELGRNFAKLIETESHGDQRVFLKLFTIAIKDNPRALHPSARAAFKQNLLTAAERLRLPPTQVETLRRLLTESRSDAVNHLADLGWLED